MTQDDATAQRLKPCPFCGGLAYATRTVNGTQMFKVGCAACGFEFKAAWYRDEDRPTKDIVGLWNTRLGLEASQAELAEQKKALRLWRGWAQFVYLGGGEIQGTDDELQRRVCEAQDARESRGRREQAAQIAALQAELNQAVYVSDKRAAERDKAEARAEQADATVKTLREKLDELRVISAQADAAPNPEAYQVVMLALAMATRSFLRNKALLASSPPAPTQD